VIASGYDSDDADGAIAVALTLDDVELEVRVRDMLAQDPGFQIVDGGEDADIRVTDGVVSLEGRAPVLVLSAGLEAIEALQAGAAAVLSESSNADVFRAAIRAVAQGLTVVTEDLRDQLFPRSYSGLGRAEDELSAVELTDRELQVLALLAEGASNKSIARSLGITPHTAKFHVASIVAKLGATGRTEAVAKAMRMGLLMI
jgi:DNA-binding NarL/FixJ family response regulator